MEFRKGLEGIDNPLITLCRLSFKRFHSTPSKYPMFSDLVQVSQCDKDNVTVTLLELQQDLDRARDAIIPPTGFIFHETRCGSTLASNMLAASEQNLVFSEADPLAYIIRHHNHLGAPEHQTRAHLQAIIRQNGHVDMQSPWRSSGATSRHRRLFFKFCPTMMLRMQTVLGAFPTVPWLFLYRHPTEILVSHMRLPMCGNAMQRQPPRVLLRPMELTSAQAKALAPRQFCAAYLGALCKIALVSAQSVPGRSTAWFLNYNRLKGDFLDHVLPEHFGTTVDVQWRAQALASSQFYSKGRDGRQHSDDVKKKQDESNAHNMDMVLQWGLQHLRPLYNELERYASSRNVD